MVEWLAGNRIRGTSTERTSTTGFDPVLDGVGGWKELGRNSGTGVSSVDVGTIADKRYLMILSDYSFSDAATIGYRYNSDSGTNYSNRWSSNGVDSSQTSSTVNFCSLNETTKHFAVDYVSNYQTKEKLVLGNSVRQSTAGAGTAPNRDETVGKWANTTNAITSLLATSQGTNDMTGTTVVLGWDPADTHTSNFWEELYSGDLSGGAATYIDSGTITAKKYLWYQIFSSQTISSDFVVTFNADTGTNYARRYSYNGGGDVFSETSMSSYPHTANAANTPCFFNAFVINNSANEKLIIAHDIMQSTAGAGTAPNRLEGVGKWANTSAQITSMRVTSPSGNLNTGTYLRIWGSD